MGVSPGAWGISVNFGVGEISTSSLGVLHDEIPVEMTIIRIIVMNLPLFNA